jgi:hypothetical protein
MTIPRNLLQQKEGDAREDQKQTLTRRLDYIVFNKAYFRGESARISEVRPAVFLSSGANPHPDVMKRPA